MYDENKVTFANVTKQGNDVTIDIKEGFQCYEASRSRYDINSLLRVVKAANCKDVTRKDNSELLSIEFNIREGIRLQFLLGAVQATPILRS